MNKNPYILVVVAEGTLNPSTGKKVYLRDEGKGGSLKRLGGVGTVIANLLYRRLQHDPRITAHTNRLDIKIQTPTYDVRGGETMYTDSYVAQKLGAAAVQYLKNGAQTGMAVVNFDEDGNIEVVPISELIKPNLVHTEVLRLFERSGLYCFGREPGKELYAPPVSLGKSVNVII